MTTVHSSNSRIRCSVSFLGSLLLIIALMAGNLPGQSKKVEWKLSSDKAKKYHVNIPNRQITVNIKDTIYNAKLNLEFDAHIKKAEPRNNPAKITIRNLSVEGKVNNEDISFTENRKEGPEGYRDQLKKINNHTYKISGDNYRIDKDPKKVSGFFSNLFTMDLNYLSFHLFEIPNKSVLILGNQGAFITGHLETYLFHRRLPSPKYQASVTGEGIRQGGTVNFVFKYHNAILKTRSVGGVKKARSAGPPKRQGAERVGSDSGKTGESKLKEVGNASMEFTFNNKGYLEDCTLRHSAKYTDESLSSDSEKENKNNGKGTSGRNKSSEGDGGGKNTVPDMEFESHLKLEISRKED